MARDVSIVITDHNTGPCTQAYGIRIQTAADMEWMNLPDQYDSPVVISNLLDDIDYNYEIRRKCCDGNISVAATGTFTTTP